MLGMDKLSWDILGSDSAIAAGTTLGEPVFLFEKIDDAAIKAQTDRLERIKRENIIKNWQPGASESHSADGRLRAPRPPRRHRARVFARQEGRPSAMLQNRRRYRQAPEPS